MGAGARSTGAAGRRDPNMRGLEPVRFLAWLITIPLAAVAVSFAVSNRDLVTFGLWPLPQELVLPRFLAVFGPLVLGLVIGALVAWASAGRHRRTARQRGYRLEQLNAEVRRLRERQAEFEEAGRRAGEADRLDRASSSANAVARLEKPAAPTVDAR